MSEPTATEPVQPITRDQATALVGRHLLVALEEVIKAHEPLLANEEAGTEVQRANAGLVVAAAQAIGRPLYIVVKAAERPRILRPDRHIHVVR